MTKLQPPVVDELGIFPKFPEILGKIFRAKSSQAGLANGILAISQELPQISICLLERRARPGLGQIFSPKLFAQNSASEARLYPIRSTSINKEQSFLGELVEKLQRKTRIEIQNVVFDENPELLGMGDFFYLNGLIEPLFFEHKLWGMLYFGSTEEFSLTPQFTRGVAEIIELGLEQIDRKKYPTGHKTAKSTVKTQFGEKDQRYDLRLMPEEILEESELFGYVYEQINQIIPLDGFIGCQIIEDGDRDEFAIAFATQGGSQNSFVYPNNLISPAMEGFIRRVGEHGHTVWNQAIDKNQQAAFVNLFGNHFWSVVGVPLMAYQRLVGVLVIWSDKESYFNRRQINFIELIGKQAALSIAGAQLYRFELNQRRQSEILEELSYELLDVSNWEDLYQQAVKTMQNAFGSSTFVHISMLDGDGAEEKFVEVGLWSEPSIDVGGVVEGVQRAQITQWVIREGVPFVWLEGIEGSRDKLDLPRQSLLKSMFLIPLKTSAHEKSIGFIAVGLPDEDLSAVDAQVPLGVAIASRLTFAVQALKSKELERRQLEISQTLQEMGAIITIGLSPGEFFERLLNLLSTVVNYDSVSIFLVDDITEKLIVAGSRGFSSSEALGYIHDEVNFVSLGRFKGESKLIFYHDTAEYDDWIDFDDEGLGAVRSYIGAKLVTKGRTLGVINVDGRKPNQFDQETANTVLAFANQAAVALEGIQLYDLLNRRVTELSVINKIVSTISSVYELDQIIELTTKAIANSMYTYSFGLLMVDPELNVFIVNKHYHFTNREIIKDRINTSEGVIGRAFRLKETIIVGNVEKDDEYISKDSTVQSEIAVPIVVEGQVVGVINAESQRLNNFDEDDQSFLETLAAQLSVAIQRIDYHEQIQLYANQMSEMVDVRTRELGSEKERMQAILQNTDDGIIFADPTGRIEFVNQGVCRQTGYTAEECLNQPVQMFFSQQTSPIVRREIESVILNKGVWHGEMVMCRKDGSHFDASYILTPIIDEEDVLLGYVVGQNDITKFKEVDRLKSVFVTNVSHELRTPLTNIQTYVTLLKQGKEDRRDRYFEILDRELNRLTTLIQDLLDVGKLNIDPTQSAAQSLNLKMLLTQIFIAQQTSHGEKLVFEDQLPSTLPNVWGDQNQLQLAFKNVLTNAVLYSPEGSKIILTAGQRGQEIWVSIRDFGPGISHEELPQIFDRFFRGEASISARTAGNGLGLAITKEVIDLHRGRIEVNSKKEEGSEFIIWLPAIDPAPN